MTPNKLIFREWKKPEVTFDLRGWSWQKGLAFVERDGRRQVIQLVLPGLLAQGGVAFPGIAPTTITETCLLPPPCRTTAEEAACLRAAAAEAHSPRRATRSRNASDLPNWELVWLRHRNEILLPTPEDQPEFEKRLEVSMPKWRQEYEASRRELEDWRTKTIGQMIYLGGGRYYRELRDCKPASMPDQIERHLSLLETTYTRPLREFLGRLHGGYLNWTGEVAKHEPIIRDPVLHERWAKENGLKLAEISADKEAFLSWYRAHSPTPTRPAPNDFLDVAFPGARTAIADNALCAEVRFVINFTDGSRVWLADCPRRDPLLTPGEQSHGNWLNALFPSATGQNLPAPQPPPATKTHEPANSTVSAPATRASNAACDPFPFKKVCSELGCKPATLHEYCEKLGIKSDSITAAELGQIKDYREKRKQRPHLKQWHAPRHGPSPKRRGNMGS